MRSKWWRSFPPIPSLISVFLNLTLVAGCLQVNNSTSNDEREFGHKEPIDLSTPRGQRLYRVTEIMRTRCLICHPGAGLTTLDFSTDADFVDSGRVWPGDPDGSALYNYVKGNGVPLMPPDGALNETQIADIRTWIQEME